MNNSTHSTEMPDSSPDDASQEGGILIGSRRSKLQDSAALRVEDWPTVDELSLSNNDRASFARRYRAFRLYSSGATLSQIRNETGICAQHLYDLLDRCLKIHPDGRIYGFRALIPGIRIKSYERKKPVKMGVGDHQGGGAGAFQKLLDDYPALLDLIHNKLFPKKSRLLIAERRISVRKLHGAFLARCRELGLAERLDYPFDTDTLAYTTLCRFVEQLQNEHPEKAALHRMNPGAERKLRTNDGSDRPVLSLMERVECDAHHLDAVFCVLVPTSFGNFVPRILKRLNAAKSLGYVDIFYHPREIYPSSNDNSTVKLFRGGMFNVASLGDIEHVNIGAMLRRCRTFKSEVDVLILAHHGSKNDVNSKNLFQAVRPRIAICSSDYDNQYGHPHEDVKNVLYELGVPVFTTKTGDILIESLPNHRKAFRVTNLNANSTGISSQRDFVSKKFNLLKMNDDSIRNRLSPGFKGLK